MQKLPNRSKAIAKSVLFLSVFAVFLSLACADAAVIFTYDFPGSQPNNALAVNQTNPQPVNGTFSDCTRQGGLTATDSNVFGTKNWSANPAVDLTQYEGFSITANPFYVLNLTQISFDIANPSDGPGDFQIRLFLNGSATPFEISPTYNLQGVTTTLTWDFTDVLAADNVASAEFRFYGWNTPSAGAHLTLDNLATSGSIVVPEPPNAWAGIAGILLAGGTLLKGARRRPIRGPSRDH